MKNKKKKNAVSEEKSLQDIFGAEPTAEAVAAEASEALPPQETAEVEAPAVESVTEAAVDAEPEAPAEATVTEAAVDAEPSAPAEVAATEEPSAPEEVTEGADEASAETPSTPKKNRRGKRRSQKKKAEADEAEASPEAKTSPETEVASEPETSSATEPPSETEDAPCEPSSEADGASAEETAPAEDGATEPSDEPLAVEECPAPKKKKKRVPRPLTVESRDGAALLSSRDTVQTLRTDLLIALLPLLGWAVYLYGLRPLTLALVSVVSACLLDLGCHALTRRRLYLNTDGAVIGALIALGLPPTAPLWLPCVAAAIAVLPVRLLWKGRLRSFLNPSVLALLVLTLVLPGMMTDFSAIHEPLAPLSMTVTESVEAGESILDLTLNGSLPETDTLGSVFFGLRAGRIGESSVLLLLAAALFLGLRKQMRWWLPLFFLLTVGVLTYLFPRTAVASDMIALRYMGYQLMGTELLFGALFLASDAAASPRSPRAAILCGMLGGAMTVGLRYYAEPQIAVLASVFVIGLLSGPLDILLRPTVFGGRRRKKKSAPVTHTPEPQA